MGFESDAPTYVEPINLPSLSSAFFCFERDFDVDIDLLVDLDLSKADLTSKIQNYYEANGISIRNGSLTAHVTIFDLVFKIVVGELLLKKIEHNYKTTTKFTKSMVKQITQYNRIRTGYNKYNRELHKHLRDTNYYK